MNPNLTKKVEFAIRLLKQAEQAASKFNEPVEIAYSGGKDSDVILELAKMAKINFRAIYRDTSIDPPFTKKHCLENNVEVIKPKKTFIELIKEKGFPTRFRRHCCSVLKEYKILNVCVMGVRRDESAKRKERYKEPTECRFYGSKKNHVEAFYPILNFTNQDINEFISDKNIRVHPLYYDEQGVFHVERRLGCLGCPLKSRINRIESFKTYPNLLKMYALGGGYYRDNHPESSTCKHFSSVYEQITMDLFCDSLEDFNNRFGKNLFDEKTDCKTFLEDFFNIKFNEQ